METIDNMIRVPPSTVSTDVINGAKALYDSQDFTDVNFRVESNSGIRELGAHKFMLAIRSPFFAERFRTEGIWSMKSTVLCDTCNYNVMACVLDFIYTDLLLYPKSNTLKLNLEFLAQVTCEAKKYNLFRLAALVNKEFLSLLEASDISHTWHKCLVSIMVFAKQELTDEYDFGLYGSCLHLLSVPRDPANSDRVEFLEPLIESSLSKVYCPPDIGADILIGRCGSKSCLFYAVLCGRSDIVEILLGRSSSKMSSTASTETSEPLELALFLSRKLNPDEETVSQPPEESSRFEDYLFALDWLHSKQVDEIIGVLVKNASLIDSENETFVLNNTDIFSLEQKREALLGIAAMHGNENYVKILINSGADLNTLIPLFGMKSPLHIAAARGHAAIVEMLLWKGAVPNLQDREGNTALHFACKSFKCVEVISILVGDKSIQIEGTPYRPANINIPDINGWTVLHHIAYNGNDSACSLLLNASVLSDDSLRELLLAAEYNNGSTALHIAAENAHLNVIKEILCVLQQRRIIWPVEMKCEEEDPKSTQPSSEESSEANCYTSPYLDIKDLARHTALHRACMKACDSFFDITQTSQVKNAMFDNACRCIELLLEKGADPLARTVVGYIPLHYLLCGSQSSKNRTDDGLAGNKLSFLALHRQISDNTNKESRRRFSGVDLLADEWKENTMITRPLKLLLGAAPSGIHASAKDHITPLHCAVRFKHVHAAAVLVSLLFVVLEKPHLKAIKVKRGADIHARDMFHNSPLSLAREFWPFPILANYMLKLLPTTPEWVDDKETDRCESCSNVFSVTVRRHHCRHCGSIVCAPCSSNTMSIPQFGIESKVRVCTACHEALSWPNTISYANVASETTKGADKQEDSSNIIQKKEKNLKKSTKKKRREVILS